MVLTTAVVMLIIAAVGDPQDRRAVVMATTCDYYRVRRLEQREPPAEPGEPAEPAEFAAAIAAGEGSARPFSPVAALRRACATSPGGTP